MPLAHRDVESRRARVGLSVAATAVGGVVHALSTAPVPDDERRGGEGVDNPTWTLANKPGSHHTTEHRPFQTRSVRRVAHTLTTATLLIEGSSPWTKRGQPRQAVVRFKALAVARRGRTSPLSIAGRASLSVAATNEARAARYGAPMRSAFASSNHQPSGKGAMYILSGCSGRPNLSQ